MTSDASAMAVIVRDVFAVVLGLENSLEV